MFKKLIFFFKNIGKNEEKKETSNTAKERLHLVLMQDRANVSADFLELMKQEIIEVIKKYIEVDEKEIDVHLTNKSNEDGTLGAPALYANIPIMNIKKEETNNEKKNINEEVLDVIEEKVNNEGSKHEDKLKGENSDKMGKDDTEKDINKKEMIENKNEEKLGKKDKVQETSA